MDYIKVPLDIDYFEIKKNKFSLSPAQYKKVIMKNDSFLSVRDFLSRPLTRRDLGNEVGSLSYINQSPCFFIRTKALQANSFLPEINYESTTPILPKAFVQMNLKEGDILISKDSNIGEAVIFDKDYPDFMLSGAIYRLPIIENKYYLLAFLKHNFCREQLDFMAPKSATIRHAKTLFLDVKIPMPKRNKTNVIKYIEILTQSIINKEKEIRFKHELIHQLIEKELINNQKTNEFIFDYPNLNEVKKIGRLDTGLYNIDYKKKNFLVLNCKNGNKNLIERGFSYVRGSSLEMNYIKTRINSDFYFDGFYELVIPTNISIYGTIDKSTFIGTSAKLKTIKQSDIIFGGEGFGKGRSFVVCYDSKNIATNYHAIRIINKNKDLSESIFIRCFLSYWRSLGMIDFIGVGGSGGHCAPAYFHLIDTPLFPENKQNEIVELYHNKIPYLDLNTITLDNFLNLDSVYNKIAGIIELDKTLKSIRILLNSTIDKIINDVDIDINFNSLNI